MDEDLRAGQVMQLPQRRRDAVPSLRRADAKSRLLASTDPASPSTPINESLHATRPIKKRTAPEPLSLPVRTDRNRPAIRPTQPNSPNITVPPQNTFPIEPSNPRVPIARKTLVISPLDPVENH